VLLDVRLDMVAGSRLAGQRWLRHKALRRSPASICNRDFESRRDRPLIIDVLKVTVLVRRRL